MREGRPAVNDQGRGSSPTRRRGGRRSGSCRACRAEGYDAHSAAPCRPVPSDACQDGQSRTTMRREKSTCPEPFAVPCSGRRRASNCFAGSLLTRNSRPSPDAMALTLPRNFSADRYASSPDAGRSATLKRHALAKVLIPTRSTWRASGTGKRPSFVAALSRLRPSAMPVAKLPKEGPMAGTLKTAAATTDPQCIRSETIDVTHG